MLPIKVRKCPQCGAKYDKPLEPYIKATDNSHSPAFGLKCPICAYGIEYYAEEALPLTVDNSSALFLALCEIIKIAFINRKRINLRIMEEQCKQTT